MLKYYLTTDLLVEQVYSSRLHVHPAIIQRYQSIIGVFPTGTQQLLELGQDVEDAHQVLPLLFKVLGRGHENQRADRNRHILVMFENVHPGKPIIYSAL